MIIIRIICLFFLTIHMISNVHASEIIAYGFDYPIGNRGYDNSGNKISIDEHIRDLGNDYNVDRNEEYNFYKGIAANNSRSGSSGNFWYNINDTGNFVSDKYTKGVHPGEDWNYGSKGDDAGKPIYAVANGVVKEISKVYSTGADKAGWKIILKHKLPDNSYVYSIYLHVTSSNNTDGEISDNASDFSVSVNDNVDKGDMIARLATDMEYVAEHLHFEIRNKFTSGSDLYKNANKNGYYTNNGSEKTSMTKDQVISAFNKMRSDGIFDPSDFIDDHRDIRFWTGNGSIISHHAINVSNTLNGSRANISDSEYPYGITQDVTMTHVKTQKPVGFFQWQISDSCDRLRIEYNSSNYQDRFADITVGSWHTREYDITFENVPLPFVLGQSNTKFEFNYSGTGWFVVAVALRNNNLSSERISATCTDETPTVYSKELIKGKSTIVDGYKWNGNGSIISRIYKKSSHINYSVQPFGDWPYGAFRDVTQVHKSQYKPIVFFQWMASDICTSLTIDVPTLGCSEKKVKLGVKSWADSSYDTRSVTLPYTIDDENRLWNVIRIAFDNPVSQDARVEAKCNGF